ncbi:Uncharacterised protein [Streptococcus dysgalactiae subsp. equisimilis]|uniref:Uncharacterized protein n=1 Tax=Streptococcus dysgalactiae subsp. equisimilis TaxID=119602 RepID=A0A9X8T327_STREQ|nr:Uncharacterised protein [Streptococcus dysgalactiae]SQG93230.1 Uncharacterised protein [Streptococcus dysgalactiae subsp. equisimilis]SUN63363.1 Uncharacterised protein [Streptococcus dysgalactiae subsp. equisimilis]VTS27986.1 Uncharacterised protein [Streptococcus dysgalactiae subsp. equisimilis]VTT03859.1 Uncharacterised protein [Streptococcus dysgalactiae subsp. equisimilis]
MNSLLELETLPVEFTPSIEWKICKATIVVCGSTFS